MLKSGLEIVAKGEVVERVMLNRRETRIGRRDDNDVVLSNVSVSRHHAKIVDEDGHFRVWDLGSANGVLVNGKKIAEKAPIKLGDEIAIGKFILRFVELDTQRADVRAGQARDDAPLAAGTTFEMGGDSARRLREAVRQGDDPDDTRIRGGKGAESESTMPPTRPLPEGEPRRVLRVFENKELMFEKTIEHVPFAIGRASDNDLILNKSGVSRYHAVIHRDGPRYTLEDLGSRNGTFVNGEKLKSTVLSIDAEIKIGDFLVAFSASADDRGEGDVVAAEVVESSTPDAAFEIASGGRTMSVNVAKAREQVREAAAAAAAPGTPAPAPDPERNGGRFDFPVKEVAVSVQYLGWVTTTRYAPGQFERAEGSDAARDLVVIRLDMGDRVLSRTIPVAAFDLEGRVTS